MNTTDRDTYDFEVTGLRNSGILEEIRSGSAAQQLARQRRVDKSVIPRFRVSHSPSGKTEFHTTGRPVTAVLPRRELFPEETGIFVGDLAPPTSEAELRSIFQR